jgi:hypothetical protein
MLVALNTWKLEPWAAAASRNHGAAGIWTARGAITPLQDIGWRRRDPFQQVRPLYPKGFVF